MNIENDTFLLCFTAVIWRRIFTCLILYCEHNSAPFNIDNLLKSFKYNLLAQTGFVNEMKPFLIKSFRQGFLMPKDYSSNKYVSKAIRLFGDAYKICKIEDLKLRKKEENKFIHSFIVSDTKQNNNEMIDCLKISFCKNDKNDKKSLIGKHCFFCELMDSWDVDLRLINNSDPYQELITYSLLKSLDI